MNYLVCRGESEIKVFLPEISILILESTAISLTCSLISELVKNNVKIIFCDEKHNPESELVALNGSYNSSKKLMFQINWSQEIKGKVWKEIVKAKISNQQQHLSSLGCQTEANMLLEYISQVEWNDNTNREGHAAKVYFNALFGMDFVRRDLSFHNNVLNYGYAIILSIFNREVVKNGYLTQLGIWHKNEFNFFNLSCDLMEPFRIIVDRYAIDLQEGTENFKLMMLEMLDLKVKISGKQQTLENAIAIYCQSVFDALNEENEALIKFYEL